MHTIRCTLIGCLTLVLFSAQEAEVRGQIYCVDSYPYGYSYSYPVPGYYAGPVYGTPQQAYTGSEYQSRRYGPADGRRSGGPIVQMTDRARFEPAQITVNVGETVEWRSTSTHPHTVTADRDLAANPAHVVLPQDAEPFHSGEIAPGGRYSYTFEVPGIYYYVCLPHEEQGMVGIVVVRPEGGQSRRAGGSEPGGASRGY